MGVFYVDVGDNDVLAISADVTELETLERFIARTIEQLGKIDILVNNAGRSAGGDFETLTDEDWYDDLDLKLMGAVRCARLVIPHMKCVGGGRIINVTHPGGKQPGAGSYPTSVSRAAGIAMTKALSKELLPHNILVNTVCIGLIKSGQHEKRYEHARQQETTLSLEQFYQRGSTSVPLMRFGDSQEAGDVICFVASERASYLTGTSINIDGGSCSVT